MLDLFIVFLASLFILISNKSVGNLLLLLIIAIIGLTLLTDHNGLAVRLANIFIVVFLLFILKIYVKNF